MNEENELFKEKSILILDKLIYPKSLFECLKEQIKSKKFTPEFFGGDFIRVIVLSDNNEERLDDISDKFILFFKEYVEKTNFVCWDEEEVKLTLDSIYQQIINGIPEKSFYDWFMKWTFQARQFTVPLDEYEKPKKGYNPASKIVSYKFSNGLISNYIFFSSNGSLLNEITLNALIKKVEEEIKEIISYKTIRKNNKRNPIDSRLRHEVFKRDGYKCKECGATKEEKTLHCDHIIPVSQGGTDEMDNLQTLCSDCNLAKSDKIFSNELKKEVFK